MPALFVFARLIPSSDKQFHFNCRIVDQHNDYFIQLVCHIPLYIYLIRITNNAKNVSAILFSELLQLIEVGASCFNHYCAGYDDT